MSRPNGISSLGTAKVSCAIEMVEFAKFALSTSIGVSVMCSGGNCWPTLAAVKIK